MKEAPVLSLMVASSERGICWPAGAGAILRFHANDKIEEFFALDNLGGGLAADSRLDDGFDVGDVDAVASDFLAVGIDNEAGLAEFADDGELLEARRLVQRVADFDGFLLEDVQIGA